MTSTNALPCPTWTQLPSIIPSIACTSICISASQLHLWLRFAFLTVHHFYASLELIRHTVWCVIRLWGSCLTTKLSEVKLRNEYAAISFIRQVNQGSALYTYKITKVWERWILQHQYKSYTDSRRVLSMRSALPVMSAAVPTVMDSLTSTPTGTAAGSLLLLLELVSAVE